MSKIYIVATPIGNLGDITIRAIQVLSRVDLIYCEDTRVSRQLLRHYNITTRLRSYHEYNEEQQSREIIRVVASGREIAIISDAGTPTVSDPGVAVIRAARAAGITVEALPGASALTLALVYSGMGPPVTFYGFPPRQAKRRLREWRSLTTGTHIYFIAPHSLSVILSEIQRVCQERQVEWEVYLGKEYTKVYEYHWYGTASQVQAAIEDTTIKGEYVLALRVPRIRRGRVNKYDRQRYHST